jgi:hypothetical protein
MRRRRFMMLMAASAAAVLTKPLESALAAPARKQAASPPPPRPLTPAVRKEIANQKASVADTLRVIRAYDLPPGSRPAYLFRAERRSGSRDR